MKLKIVQDYMKDCTKNGVDPSWTGLKDFNNLILKKEKENYRKYDN